MFHTDTCKLEIESYYDRDVDARQLSAEVGGRGAKVAESISKLLASIAKGCNSSRGGSSYEKEVDRQDAVVRQQIGVCKGGHGGAQELCI